MTRKLSLKIAGILILVMVVIMTLFTVYFVRSRTANMEEELLSKGKIEVLAGANLPSLIKLIGVRISLPLEKAVCEAIDSGRKYMRSGSTELTGGPTRPS